MSKFLTFVSWSDVPHIPQDAQAEMVKSYAPHERDARTKGIPALGSGAIYPVPESDVVIDPFELPAHFKHVYALDVGWNRTAGLWGAHDTETDVLYLYSEHYRGQAEPAIHAEAVRARGKWIPGVIDPASRGRGQHDGEQLLFLYQQLGLNISTADNAVEAGIYKVWLRLSTGRIRVFKNLQNFLGEYRIYRRDEKGKIVKENDHLLDCLRYMVMSGIDIASFRPVEDFRAKIGLQAKHESAYNPMEDAWKVHKQRQQR